jgi:hypothetical protein
LCILEYSIVLSWDSSKCRGIRIVSYILQNYYRDKWVTVNKIFVTYWWYGSLLSSQFVSIWEYWCIL